jgi:hypothetical protein
VDLSLLVLVVAIGWLFPYGAIADTMADHRLVTLRAALGFVQLPAEALELVGCFRPDGSRSSVRWRRAPSADASAR